MIYKMNFLCVPKHYDDYDVIIANKMTVTKL